MNSGSSAGLRRTARIDLRAFSRNLTRLLEQADDFVLDARANAYGHGLAAVVRAALQAGVSTVRVSPHEAALPGVKRSSLMTVAPRRRLIGAEAYGLGSGMSVMTEPVMTEPVMTLSGEVVAVKAVEAGVGVSYGYSYRTPDATTLALVALGYADGIPRLASNRATVWVGGAQHPLVGRVAMDQFVTDCGTSVPEVGAQAILFGDGAAGHPLATEWAAQTERSALELTAGIGSRVTRVYE